MNRDPIFLRVDATPETGYERLQRCLIVAAALQRRRRPVYFLSQLDPASQALTIKRGGNDWIGMNHRAGSAEDFRQTLKEIHRLRPAAVLVDDANVSHDYLREIGKNVPLLVSIDHLAATRLPSQLIVNPLLGPSKESYEYEPGTQVLMGKRYGLVRPEIRRYRPTRSQEPAPLPVVPGKVSSGQFRALVALGEDDPNLQTIEIAKLLLATPKIGKVDMIVRRDHPQVEEMRALVEANADRLELAVEPAEITARLVRGHFAITSGSSWSQELACIGIPQLMVLQNESHWPNAQRLEEEGCASCLGWHENVSPATIRLAVQNLLSDPLERQAMARCGRKLIDGRGPDRLVNALEIMLAGTSRKVSPRLAA